VVQARLESEYNVLTDLEPLALELARWVTGPEGAIERIGTRSEVVLTRDTDDHYVVLFSSPFYLRYTAEKFPELKFDTLN
jgi:peptide chain release factor 3